MSIAISDCNIRLPTLGTIFGPRHGPVTYDVFPARPGGLIRYRFGASLPTSFANGPVAVIPRETLYIRGPLLDAETGPHGVYPCRGFRAHYWCTIRHMHKAHPLVLRGNAPNRVHIAPITGHITCAQPHHTMGTHTRLPNAHMTQYTLWVHYGYTPTVHTMAPHTVR